MCKTSLRKHKQPSPLSRRKVFTRCAWSRIFVLFLITFCATRASADALPQSLTQALQASAIPLSHVAIYAQDLAQATPLFSLNADVAMNPASVMKLLTTYAALDSLGPTFRWQTVVLRQGELRQGKLKGDLIFKGGGDPKITLENFWLMLRDLRQRGLKTIQGDLILDRSFFELAEEDPAAFDGAPYKPYNLAPDALLLDFRSQRLRLFVDADASQPRLLFDPPVTGARLLNQIRLADEACGEWKDKIQVRRDATTLQFLGVYPRSCGEQTLNLVLQDRDAYFAERFRELWTQLGGRWRGKVISAATPASAITIATYPSATLTEVIRDINKYSNNVMARQLFLSLGAQTQAPPATLTKGAAAVDNWLGAQGQHFLELRLENGSGLSRRERISAGHLAWLLQHAYRGPYAAEFIASLPILALDGTMAKRLRDGDIAGHAHLKTGSLKDVRAVAGFVRDRLGRDIVLVLLINDDKAEAGRAAQDALLTWLFNRP